MRRLIDNGLGSIRVGLEDYEKTLSIDDDARLTSAIRNVFAGIIILAKAKLDEWSPEDKPGMMIWIIRPTLRDGQIQLTQEGRKTITYEEVKKRFAHFSLPLDWKKVDRVHEIRNDLEHLYHDGAKSAVQEALADAEVVIRDLLVMLKLDPVHDLGEHWWSVLLKNNAVFVKQLDNCRETLLNMNWRNPTAGGAKDHFDCGHCGSSLIRQADPLNHAQDDIQFSCDACGSETDIGTTLERAIGNQYFRELYETQTRGGEPPVVRCPKCKMYTLVLEANECAVCECRLNASTPWCDTCRNPMTEDERVTNSHECPAFFHS